MHNYIGKKQIALLHVAKKQLGLKDEEYQAILNYYGQCEKTNQITQKQFTIIMVYFTRLGFHSTWSKRHYGERKGMATSKQIELIRSLWKQYSTIKDNETLDVTLNNWLSQYHKISALRFVTSEKAKKVIAALKAMTKRNLDQAIK